MPSNLIKQSWKNLWPGMHELLYIQNKNAKEQSMPLPRLREILMQAQQTATKTLEGLAEIYNDRNYYKKNITVGRRG